LPVPQRSHVAGGAVKGFRSAMSDAEKEEPPKILDSKDDATFDSTESEKSGEKKS